MKAQLYQGDMRERLAEFAAESIDAIVTDPPYHLTTGKQGGSGPASVNLDSPYGRARVGTGFMGMKWDGGDVALRPETWAAMLRVAKPGAHLIAFGGTRTFHRIWCAIEDAGWQIRDTLMWLYGQGFPKSANQAGAWDGWGTALKPAFEPIVLARKPLDGTVAENLQQHRVGALNIDGTRIETTDSLDGSGGPPLKFAGDNARPFHEGAEPRGMNPRSAELGRWPANVLHDGSEEIVAAFPSDAGAFAPVRGTEPSSKTTGIFGKFEGRNAQPFHDDRGSAARFFWCPKASRADRNDGLHGMPKRALNWSSGDENPGSFQSEGTDRESENFHPTVKPTELMQYLCRLVAPRGATVLDPFMGSGSTGKAAVLEGMNFVGIELDGEYMEIARRRIASPEPLFTEIDVA